MLLILIVYLFNSSNIEINVVTVINMTKVISKYVNYRFLAHEKVFNAGYTKYTFDFTPPLLSLRFDYFRRNYESENPRHKTSHPTFCAAIIKILKKKHTNLCFILKISANMHHCHGKVVLHFKMKLKIKFISLKL